MAADAIESSLLKYSAKEYFFKAALCQMCEDVLEAQRAVEKYCDMYAAFQDTRECKLLKVPFHVCNLSLVYIGKTLHVYHITFVYIFLGVARGSRRGKCGSIYRSGEQMKQLKF